MNDQPREDVSDGGSKGRRLLGRKIAHQGGEDDSLDRLFDGGVAFADGGDVAPDPDRDLI